MKQSNVKYWKVFWNLLIFITGIILCIFLLPKLLVFFMPFIVGWLIAAIANPLVRILEEKLKIRRKAGTAILIVLVIAGIVGIGYLVISKLVTETSSFIQDLPRLWEAAESDLKEIGQNMQIFYSRLPIAWRVEFEALDLNLDDAISDMVAGLGSPTMSAVGNFAKRVPSILIAMIMGALSSYFFIADRLYLSKYVKRFTGGSAQRKWILVYNSLRQAVGGYVKAQLKIEVVVYIILVIGLSILRIDYVLLIAFGIALLDILPFFGTGFIMLPWAVIKLLSADYRMAIGLLIIWLVSQLLRQIIQPKIVGDSIGMPPIPTLFLLYIGYKMGGVGGMIIAVPVGIILVNLNEEGVFDNVKNSMKILWSGINTFRRITPEDMEDAGIEKED